jgi:hypothetical protein
VYSTRSNLILGFHGCEKSEQQKLICDPSYIRASNESFDWLGHGMYFWENNPSRGLLWAEQKKMAGRIKEPSVIGAVIDLGRCLDLLDLRYLDCAVIEYTHSFLNREKQDPFDSVRAAFIEGDPIYPGAGFNDKTHIQLCIINPNCIKGFFLPRPKRKV